MCLPAVFSSLPAPVCAAGLLLCTPRHCPQLSADATCCKMKTFVGPWMEPLTTSFSSRSSHLLSFWKAAHFFGSVKHVPILASEVVRAPGPCPGCSPLPASSLLRSARLLPPPSASGVLLAHHLSAPRQSPESPEPCPSCWPTKQRALSARGAGGPGSLGICCVLSGYSSV